MGLPIERIVVAVNSNDILGPRARRPAATQRGEVAATSSPAMDIQAASNFERLYFEATERDATGDRAGLRGIRRAGAIDIPPHGAGGHARPLRRRSGRRGRDRARPSSPPSTRPASWSIRTRRWASRPRRGSGRPTRRRRWWRWPPPIRPSSPKRSRPPPASRRRAASVARLAQRRERYEPICRRRRGGQGVRAGVRAGDDAASTLCRTACGWSPIRPRASRRWR